MAEQNLGSEVRVYGDIAQLEVDLLNFLFFLLDLMQHILIRPALVQRLGYF